MARIAVFDPFSGASGDMILGALVDVGVPGELYRNVIAQLALTGVSVSADAAASLAVRGTRVSVAVTVDQPARDWRHIRELLAASALEAPVREAALAVFAALADVEAAAHGVAPDDVHFHEVGAADAIVDIVGACAGLHHLGIDRVVSYPVAVGAGWARAAHGLLPVPAPATALLLQRASVPIRPYPRAEQEPGELLTPTGAAILSTLADWTVPPFAPLHLGYGFGTRELPWPNALRLWIGETLDAAPDAEGELLFATNIDDMNPQFFAPLSDRLFAAGALDVWLTPAIMKKGRPATVVSAIAPAAKRAEIERIMILETTTLGVRVSPISRAKAWRTFVTVTSRWGEVRLKLRGWDGRVIGAMPEYDDCLRLSDAAGVPIREVWAEANRLGEVFAGLRVEQFAGTAAGVESTEPDPGDGE